MDSKKKAIELVEHHLKLISPILGEDGRLKRAKLSAEYTVSEIMKNLEELSISSLETYTNPKITYWKEVKKEIKKV